jgi:hypothetical protein
VRDEVCSRCLRSSGSALECGLGLLAVCVANGHGPAAALNGIDIAHQVQLDRTDISESMPTCCASAGEISVRTRLGELRADRPRALPTTPSARNMSSRPASRPRARPRTQLESKITGGSGGAGGATRAGAAGVGGGLVLGRPRMATARILANFPALTFAKTCHSAGGEFEAEGNRNAARRRAYLPRGGSTYCHAHRSARTRPARSSVAFLGSAATA